MPLKDESQEEPKSYCVACAGASECEIWGQKACYPCAADFNRRMPTYGEIAAKHGPNADNVAVYREFTQRWIEKRKSELSDGRGVA